jgi:nitrate reductase NapE component
MSKGWVRDEGFWGELVGTEVTSSRPELRRRLWFDETQDAQADVIPPCRRRFFVGFVNVVVTGIVVVVSVFVFWWFWINVLERGGRDEILGVELFRRV